MKLFPDDKIKIIENFVSLEEVAKLRDGVFDLQPYWKNILEFPAHSFKLQFLDEKSLFLISKNLKDSLNQNDNIVDDNLVNYVMNLIKGYYKLPDSAVKYFIPIEWVRELLIIGSQFEELNHDLMKAIKNHICKKDVCQNMLGDAIYLLSKNRGAIDWEVQQIIRKRFDWMHQKVIDKFENLFEEKVILDKTLPCPGFHVFGPCEYQDLEFHYHKDINIFDYYSNVDPNTVYSYVTLVESPDEKPFLDYVHDEQPYEYTNLYIWKGMKDHRIGTFSLKKNEYRITFQGHLFYDKNHNVIKLYF